MMQERHLSEKLETVLAGLSVEYRTIFNLRFIEGRSNKKVSRLLGVPVSALTCKAKRVRLKVLGEMQSLLDDHS